MYRSQQSSWGWGTSQAQWLPRQRVVALIAIMLTCSFASVSQDASPERTTAPSVIQYLNQSINWYQQLGVEQQIADEPRDALVLNDNRQIANQVVRLAFDYARAEATALARQGTSTSSDTQNAAAARFQSLTQLSAKLDGQAKELEREIDGLRQKLDTATGKRRQVVKNDLEETQSELQLVEVRRDVIRSMLEFVSGTSASGVGASGLRGQIESLARSVPAANSIQAGDQNNGTGAHANTPASTVSVTPSNKSEPSGIWGLEAVKKLSSDPTTSLRY